MPCFPGTMADLGMCSGLRFLFVKCLSCCGSGCFKLIFVFSFFLLLIVLLILLIFPAACFFLPNLPCSLVLIPEVLVLIAAFFFASSSYCCSGCLLSSCYNFVISSYLLGSYDLLSVFGSFVVATFSLFFFHCCYFV